MADADDNTENNEICDVLFGESDDQEGNEGFDINDLIHNVQIMHLI